MCCSVSPAEYDIIASNNSVVLVDNVALTSDSPSSYLWRIQWRERAFQWLRQKRQYYDFDLDSCLSKLEENPLLREAALAAFWCAYLANELPPILTDLQDERIKKLLYYGSLHDLHSEDIKDLAFVKLHLADLLAICLIRPDWPIAENPSAKAMLEKILEAYRLAERPSIIDEIIDDPSGWGNKYFDENLFTFSLVMVSGIARVELSFWRIEQTNYEEAFWDITNGAWDICATTVEDKSSELPNFRPYLPHSGSQFSIQEVADIFEQVKRHSKGIKDWEYMQMGCEAIQHLGYCDLYDFLDDIRDDNGETYGAIEYWGRAATFAEQQKYFTDLPVNVLTRDTIKRNETEERLKRDFLCDIWEEMDEKAQDILVDAEMQWEYRRPDNMVKEIRPMLELILPSVFSFLEPTIKQSDGRLILTHMRDELRTNRVVRASINGLRMDVRDKEWVKNELPDFLQKVIDARNYFEKEQHLSSKKSYKYLQMTEKAVAIHRELLGIGCEGVLPRLMKIKQAAYRGK